MEKDWLDLNEHVRSVGKSNMYYVTVTGDTLKANGVDHGDLLVVDRNLSPILDDLVVVIRDPPWAATVMLWRFKHLWVAGGNKPPVPWGVVTFIIKNLRKTVDNSPQSKVS